MRRVSGRFGLRRFGFRFARFLPAGIAPSAEGGLASALALAPRHQSCQCPRLQHGLGLGHGLRVGRLASRLGLAEQGGTRVAWAGPSWGGSGFGRLTLGRARLALRRIVPGRVSPSRGGLFFEMLGLGWIGAARLHVAELG